MADVVGIGASVFDSLMLSEEFPKEDTKLKVLSTKIQGGGPCSTALVAMAKLGVSAEYFGIMGNDVFGLYLMDEFRRYGVTVDSVRLVEGALSFNSVVLLNKKNSSRTCVWDAGTLPPMREDDIPLDKLKQAQFLHLDGNHMEAAVYSAKKAHEYKVKVSLDAGVPYAGIDNLLPLVDVLIPSEEFVFKYTGEKSAEKGAGILYRQFNPEILIITQGPKGGFICDGNDCLYYKPFPVEVIDTNGAGDTFHGAFIAGLVKGMKVADAVDFASAVAAIKCTHFGAREGLPTYEEAQKIITNRPGSPSGNLRA
jgi:ribokinase